MILMRVKHMKTINSFSLSLSYRLLRVDLLYLFGDFSRYSEILNYSSHSRSVCFIRYLHSRRLPSFYFSPKTSHFV